MVCWPGIKHTVSDALSGVPTGGGDQLDLEDEIQYFVVAENDRELDWETDFDDYHDGSDPEVSLLVH